MLTTSASAASTAGKAASASFAKLPGDTVLKEKAGYWVECSYSGLGENCYYVYAKARNAKAGEHQFTRLKASDTLRKKAGYWVECSYSGLGDNCYYVYAHPQSPAGKAK